MAHLIGGGKPFFYSSEGKPLNARMELPLSNGWVVSVSSICWADRLEVALLKPDGELLLDRGGDLKEWFGPEGLTEAIEWCLSNFN